MGSNIEVILQVKEEYINKFITITRKHFIEGFNSIYNNVQNNNNVPKLILKEFQKSLTLIPLWSHTMLIGEVDRIKVVSKCDYLEELIEALFSSYSQMFTLVNNEKYKNAIKIPSHHYVIHNCYITIARALWKNPELLYHRYEGQKKQSVTLELDNLVNDNIKNAIKNLILFKDLINTHLSNLKTNHNTKHLEENLENLTLDENLGNEDTDNDYELLNTNDIINDVLIDDIVEIERVEFDNEVVNDADEAVEVYTEVDEADEADEAVEVYTEVDEVDEVVDEADEADETVEVYTEEFVENEVVDKVNDEVIDKVNDEVVDKVNDNDKVIDKVNDEVVDKVNDNDKVIDKVNDEVDSDNDNDTFDNISYHEGSDESDIEIIQDYDENNDYYNLSNKSQKNIKSVNILPKKKSMSKSKNNKKIEQYLGITIGNKEFKKNKESIKKNLLYNSITSF